MTTLAAAAAMSGKALNMSNVASSHPADRQLTSQHTRESAVRGGGHLAVLAMCDCLRSGPFPSLIAGVDFDRHM